MKNLKVMKRMFANAPNVVQILKNGTHNEMQRYRCKSCLITFTLKTKNIFSTTKLEKEKWLKYVECFVDGLSLKRCAEKKL